MDRSFVFYPNKGKSWYNSKYPDCIKMFSWPSSWLLDVCSHADTTSYHPITIFRPPCVYRSGQFSMGIKCKAAQPLWRNTATLLGEPPLIIVSGDCGAAAHTSFYRQRANWRTHSRGTNTQPQTAASSTQISQKAVGPESDFEVHVNYSESL